MSEIIPLLSYLKGDAGPNVAAECAARDAAMRTYYMGVLDTYSVPYDPEDSYSTVYDLVVTTYQGILVGASVPYDAAKDYKPNKLHPYDYPTYLMRLVNAI